MNRDRFELNTPPRVASRLYYFLRWLCSERILVSNTAREELLFQHYQAEAVPRHDRSCVVAKWGLGGHSFQYYKYVSVASWFPNHRGTRIKIPHLLNQ